MFSGAGIKSLGKQIRDGNYGDSEIRKLEEYRASFEPMLLTVGARLVHALNNAALRYVVAGRTKRIRTIIRKLVNPKNYAMDLSRMADLVGLRVIVRSMEDQGYAIAAIVQEFIGAKVTDYRDNGQPYRSVHILVKEDAGFRSLEIQVRSIAQQLWANESESFGEEVKAGGGDPEVQVYLKELSNLCASIDHGVNKSDTDGVSTYFDSRLPLSIGLKRLEANFERAGVPLHNEAGDETFLIVYDNEINQCYQKHRYLQAERQEAIEDFRRLVRTLDETRYEILVLNSRSDAALQVTHPRFFPEPNV